MAKIEFDFEAAKKLPDKIRFGTSTWTYPGWKKIVYQRDYKSEKAFKDGCLEEYGAFPWFRTVGIDHSFYRPASPKQLVHYAEQLPSGFLWVSKVWEEITIPVYPSHPRYGAKKGKQNPNFLNPTLFTREVLPAYQSSEATREKTGPFIFQFPTFSKKVLEEVDFLKRLDAFLGKLPREFRYATEIRTPKLLEQEYFEVINRHGVTHCFNHWQYMPDLASQMRKAADAGSLQADFFVARLLTPRGVKYQDAVKRFQPYDQLKEPNESMRKDAAQIARRAIERGIEAFIIVNNRSEGNAPLTIDAIGRLIVG